MSHISILPINILNLPKKYGTLSNYAQRFIKSQVKITFFALERFFGEFNSELISKHEQKLQEIGLKKIGRNINEGVIISSKESDYHVFSSENKHLGFDILKQDSNEIYQHFSLKANNNEYTFAGNCSYLNIEDEISKVLDFVEGKLLKAKSECAPARIPKPFIPDQKTSDKIAELNKILRNKKITLILKM